MSSIDDSQVDVHPAPPPPTNLDKAEQDRAIEHVNQSRLRFMMIKMMVIIRMTHPAEWEKACLTVLDRARRIRISKPRVVRQRPIPEWDPPLGSSRRQEHGRLMQEVIDQIHDNTVTDHHETLWSNFVTKQQATLDSDLKLQIEMLNKTMGELIDPEGILQQFAFDRVRRASNASLSSILKTEYLLFFVETTSIAANAKVCPAWASKQKSTNTSTPSAKTKIIHSLSQQQASPLPNSPRRPLMPPPVRVYRPLLRLPRPLGGYGPTSINFAEHALSLTPTLPIVEAPDRPRQSSEVTASPPTQPQTLAPQSSTQSAAPLSFSHAIPDRGDSRSSPTPQPSPTILNTCAASSDRPMRSIEPEDYGSPALRLSGGCTPSRASETQVRDAPQRSRSTSSDEHRGPVTPIYLGRHSDEAHWADDEVDHAAQERPEANLPTVALSPPEIKARIHWRAKVKEREFFKGAFTVSPNSRRRQSNLRYAKMVGASPPPVKSHSVSPARTLGGEEIGLGD